MAGRVARREKHPDAYLGHESIIMNRAAFSRPSALAYKAENAVDMETGAIVVVTTHGGAAADTATVQEIVVEAAIRGGRLDRRKDTRKRVSSAS